MKQVRSLLTPPVISIFCAALVVRVIYNVVVAHGYNPQHDSLTYQSIAYGLLKLHCYCFPPNTVDIGPSLPITAHPLSTTDRAPLWPIIIAAIYGLLGEQDRFVRIFLSLVGSATCMLIYCFARDLFSKRIGWFAGFVAAFYPFLFIYDGWLYTESLYTFFLLAFCYTLYRLLRTPRWPLMVLSGIVLGLLSLTRPNGFALLALFLAWLLIIGWTKTLRWRTLAYCGIIVTLLTLALIAPWTIRNYWVTQAFVPVAVGDGKVLIGAYNDNVADPSHQNGFYYGIWQHPKESQPTVWQQYPQDCSGSCEVARDNTYKNAAFEWIKSHLDKMPALLGLHFINTWQITSQEADLAINKPPTDASLSQYVAIAIVQSMMVVITPIIFVLAALGLIVTRNRWRELLFIYFMIALTIAQCIVYYGIPRFRAPIEPMLIILASGGVWWLITLLHKPFKEKNGVDFSPSLSYTRTGK